MGTLVNGFCSFIKLPPVLGCGWNLLTVNVPLAKSGGKMVVGSRERMEDNFNVIEELEDDRRIYPRHLKTFAIASELEFWIQMQIDLDRKQGDV